MGWGGVGSQKKKHSCKVQGEEQKLGKEEGEGKKYHEPAKKNPAQAMGQKMEFCKLKTPTRYHFSNGLSLRVCVCGMNQGNLII